MSPLLTAASLLLMVLQASGVLTPGSSKMTVSCVMTLFLIMVSLVPVTLFSVVAVYPSGARYCVTDLSSVGISLGHDIYTQHIVTAVYNIIYKSALVFWVPIFLLAVPVIRMIKMVNTDSDKHLKITLSVAVTISFIVFNLPLSTVAAVRQIFLIQSAPMAYKEKYLLDVLESLLKLLSFFFHVFRPLVCLVLEHGSSYTQEDFILNEKLRNEEKKLLKKDDEEI